MYLGKVVHGNGWYSDVLILYEENYIFDRNILLDKPSLADIIIICFFPFTITLLNIVITNFHTILNFYHNLGIGRWDV